MTTFAINVVMTLLIVALSLLAYDRYVRLPASRVGVIDVAETYRDKEAQFVSDIGKSSNPNDPNLALEFTGRFAADLKNALETLPSECDCLVLIKAAVAGGNANVIDLTPALRAKVGLPSKEQQ